jgi:hypothetical protein
MYTPSLKMLVTCGSRLSETSERMCAKVGASSRLMRHECDSLAFPALVNGLQRADLSATKAAGVCSTFSLIQKERIVFLLLGSANGRLTFNWEPISNTVILHALRLDAKMIFPMESCQLERKRHRPRIRLTNNYLPTSLSQ